MNQIKTKSFANTFLYNVNNLGYEKELVNFIMKGDRINKEDESFQDIRYDIKRRQISNSLLKVLDSKNVILIDYPKPLPKAFKVFVAKDLLANDHPDRVFIDCDVVKEVNGKYTCSNIDILISYLLSGMNALIYYKDPKLLVMQEPIIKSGAKAFALLFTNIVDYLYKISTITGIRDKCLYLSAMYYQINILGKDPTDSIKANARRISGISEREEQLLEIQLDNDCYHNIKFFIDSVNKVLRLPKLTIDTFLEKWLFLYGTGTQFALELYPAFATMLTNCYIGAYLNNQKTIEKITGRTMVEFSTAILRTGSELLR